MKPLSRALPIAFFLGSSSLSLFAANLQQSRLLHPPEVKQILNVSYDPTRELFQEINPKFIEKWKNQEQVDLSIKQSHGASGKQAQAVVDGLKADVVTLALAPDVDLLVKNQLVHQDWQQRQPFNQAVHY